MKVLLIDPFYNSGITPPNWSLGAIESGLRKLGVEASLIDFVDKTCEGKDLKYFLKKEEEFIEKIKKQVKKYKVVYITSSFGIPLKQLPAFPRIKKISENIKKLNRSIKIIVGGSNINYAKKMLNILPQEELNNNLIDYIVLGDENKAIDIFKRIFNTNKKTKNQEEQIITWTNWDFSKYPSYLSLITAKGCVFNCTFCFESKIFDKTYERIDINSVIKNIKFAIETKSINRFAIEDSTFLSNPDFEFFCDEIIKQNLNIKWSAYARVDQILMYKSLLPKLHEAGCTNIIVGIESPRDDILKKVRKNCTAVDSLRAVRLLKENKIGIQGCFILGFPDDTCKDIERTLDFALKLNLNTYRWHIFQPNISKPVKNLWSKTPINASDYLKIQLNVPGSCLPEVLKLSPNIVLLEEHFLIRSIPYLDQNNERLSDVGYDNLRFSQIFKIIKSRLLKTSGIFNEEKMYSLI